VSIIILKGTAGDTPMHTMEDAIAVGYWLKKNGDPRSLWLDDADGNLIMDDLAFKVRVEQYGEKVEDSLPTRIPTGSSA
jgi:hypothetical protein